MKKFGFTLAEVLITLGVIGVVAAITIPGIIKNYRKHVVEVKLAKLYSDFTKSFEYGALNNDGEEWYHFLYYNSSDNMSGAETNQLYENLYNKYMSHVRVGKIYKAGKFTKVAKNYENVTSSWSLNWHGVYEVDKRTIILICNNVIYIYLLDNDNYDFTNIIAGKNYFKFGTIYGHPSDNFKAYRPHNMSPLPSWAEYSTETLVNYCRDGYSQSWVGSKVDFCTQAFIQNGFKFPKDYPYNF